MMSSPTNKSLTLATLRNLFRLHLDAFIAENSGLRLGHKHLIGAAMWTWLVDSGFVPDQLRVDGELLDFGPKTGPGGHPIWRVAFRRSVRRDERLDRLFDGKRVGPTPLYARLAEQGILPDDPSDLMQFRHSRRAIARRDFGSPDRYVAQQESQLDLDGAEWLYVYTTRREFDLFETAQLVPLLKIGYSRSHYARRIAEQAGSTAANSSLVCIHAYRVRDGRLLEKAVHRQLKAQQQHVVDAPGIEWFEVTPDDAHRLIHELAGR
jgi:hypothetical protein